MKFRKRRKNLTLVLIGAFFLLLFLIGLFNTMFSNIREYWGKMLLGDGAIVVKNYDNYKVVKPPKREYYFSVKEIKESLKEVKWMNFSKRFRLLTLVEGFRSEKQIPMILIGADMKDEQNIISNVKLLTGRFPEEVKKEIALFLVNTGSLGVGVGDTVIVYVKNVDGYIDFDILTVSGILQPRKVQFFYGGYYVGFIPRSFATSIKGVPEDYISEVVFFGSGFLRNMLLNFVIPKKFKIVNMWESEEITLTMRWIFSFLLWLLVILIIGVVFSSIYHNVYLMIIERYREIGVYLSFGASRKWIFLILMGELTFYTLYYSIISAIASTLLILGINGLEIYATSIEMEAFFL